MPRHCSAGGCKSRDNRETRNAGITFHRLPKGETRRNLWITNSHRTDSWDPQTDFVYFCSKHFTPESFELTGCSGIRRLKEDAFPTVFDSSSKTKGKGGTGALQKQEAIPVRMNLRSDEQENTQQRDKGQPSEKATDLRSVASPEVTNENIPECSQEPSGLEQLSQRERSPSPPPASRPLSPSRYMRRLPPPPGFYLSKEHSYAQLCPLLWKRRYDQAIDCLEKALRQLHAARRRENRLRSTVLRLRDKRLKQALLVSRDGCKNRANWTPGGEKRRGRGGCDHEEGESDAKCEDTGVFEDRCADSMELGGPDSNSWSEEEKGYCFYCGRGQVQVNGQLGNRFSQTGADVQPTVDEESDTQRSVEISSGSTVGSSKDIQTVGLDRTPGQSVETNDSDVTDSEILLQTQALQHVIPAGVSLTDVHEQSLQFLGFQQKLLLSEGQVILVPVPAEDGLHSLLRMEGVADEAETVLVSEVDLKGDMGHITESSAGLFRVEPACNGEHSEQHSVLNTASVEMREDVREKLKEHLEGFHLQLSTEFLN